MRKALILAVLISACSSQAATVTNPTTSPEASSEASPVTSAPTSPTTDPETIPAPEPTDVAVASNGLPVDVFAPTDMGAHPVLVTVHGGGWVGGSPENLAPLAEELASDGVVVFNITYTTMQYGGRFPGMVEDVACGLAYARERAADYTTTPDTVFIAGFSAGAHLAALVAFAPDEFVCPDGGGAAPDGLIGLAGPYDTDRIGILATLFGATLEEDPETWARGNPLSYVEDATGIPILLIHGDEDTTAPISFSEQLNEALDEAGADVSFEVLAGGTHPDAADPLVVGDLILEFIGS